MSAKVSVLIPVYNCEDYIERCINSILKQDYDNIEIIVINDGSTDNTWEVLKKLKSKNANILTINRENKGVCETRNEILGLATGEYVMFVDADDWIDDGYIKKYVENSEGYDIVVGGFRRPNQEGKILFEVSLQEEKWAPYMSTALWSNLYRRDFIEKNNLKFVNMNIAEDIHFNLLAYNLTEKIKVIDYVGYNWFINTQSISNTTHKDIKQIEVFKFLDVSYNDLKKIGAIEKNYEILEFYFTTYILLFLGMSTSKTKFKVMSEEYDKLYSWLKERFPNYKKNKLFGFTKPKGERMNVRLFELAFMISHRLYLGKIFVYMYSHLR